MPPGRSAGRREVHQVFVVGVDLDRDNWPLQVDSASLEGLHHRQQLSVVDGVVQLRRGELPRVVADRMQLAIGVFLGQDAALREVGRVHLHRDWQIRLEVLQHRG